MIIKLLKSFIIASEQSSQTFSDFSLVFTEHEKASVFRNLSPASCFQSPSSSSSLFNFLITQSTPQSPAQTATQRIQQTQTPPRTPQTPPLTPQTPPLSPQTPQHSLIFSKTSSISIERPSKDIFDKNSKKLNELKKKKK